jgi:hypothetical protein
MAPEMYGREVAISLQLAVRTQANPAGAPSPVSVDIAMKRPGRGQTKAASDWRDEEEGALGRLLANGTNVVLLDRRAINAIGASGWQNWSERLKDRLFVIVYTSPSRPFADLGEEILLVARPVVAELLSTRLPPDSLSREEIKGLWARRFV